MQQITVELSGDSRDKRISHDQAEQLETHPNAIFVCKYYWV